MYSRKEKLWAGAFFLVEIAEGLGNYLGPCLASVATVPTSHRKSGSPSLGRTRLGSSLSRRASLMTSLLKVFSRPRRRTLHRVPRWDVGRLRVAWEKLIGDDDESGGPWSRAAL
jgi:hypothetical protein